MPTTTPTDLLSVRHRIVGIDQMVPVLDGSLQPYINFDNAASTPALQDVLDTVNEFMHWYSSVHRGTGFKSKVATQAYDDARRIVADFVGANLNDHTVIFGKNTTDAINKLSYRLPLKKDDVVVARIGASYGKSMLFDFDYPGKQKSENNLPATKYQSLKKPSIKKN